jgi:hypothetical protein
VRKLAPSRPPLWLTVSVWSLRGLVVVGNNSRVISEDSPVGLKGFVAFVVVVVELDLVVRCGYVRDVDNVWW